MLEEEREREGGERDEPFGPNRPVHHGDLLEGSTRGRVEA
jgi:hypothetical protein